MSTNAENIYPIRMCFGIGHS